MRQETELSNLKVLVIDDDEVDRMQIKNLVQHSFCLLEASTAELGLDFVKSFKPACILLDYRLPDAIGFEMLQRFVGDGYPVVILTGQGNEQVAVEALKRGAEDYLVKSTIDAMSLHKAITSAIEKSRLRKELDLRSSEIEEMIASMGTRFRNPLFELTRQTLALTSLLDSDNNASSSNNGSKSNHESQGNHEHHEKAIESAHAIQASANELMSFTTQLVDFARSASGKMDWQRVDLQELIEELCRILNIQHANMGFQIESLPVVDGDGELLQKLFKNVLENSIRNTRGTQEPLIRISSQIDRDRWKISIVDNGTGMDIQRIEDVLSPMIPEASESHLGLGMATSVKIAKRHRGHLWIESDGQTGTTVLVALPALSFLKS